MLPKVLYGPVLLACLASSAYGLPSILSSRIASRFRSPHYLNHPERDAQSENARSYHRRDVDDEYDTTLKEFELDKRLKVYDDGGTLRVGRKKGSKFGYKTSGTKTTYRPPPKDGCVHSPANRQCWDGDFDIHTDMDLRWPDTGKTRIFHWHILTKTLAPDGISKELQVINGQFPGPTIQADWGDHIEVHVTSALQTNGTGIHWHGVRQYKSNHMDGVGGVTECPIAEGETRVYKFTATQYGTSWYHSHYSVQYGEGVVGGIVIRGPATSNYDIDLGWYPVTDWFHAPVFTVNAMALHANGPPKADNFLVNGSHIYGNKGQYAVTTLKPGKRHLLRIANVGINQYAHISLNGHEFEVIAADFVPIVPYKTKQLAITIGQRYDVIIDANQPVKEYWLTVQTGGGKCDGPNSATETGDGIKAKFKYEGSTGPPDDVKVSGEEIGCHDETSLVPYVQTAIPAYTSPETLAIGFTNEEADDNLVQWLINGSRMAVDYDKPTLQNIADGNLSFTTVQNAYTLTKGKQWSYWVIQADQDSGRVPHPIHLHGHDFYILGQSQNATWNGDITTLLYNNPIRRDTATLPRLGYLVLAFEADNPGAWLMHCHVPFHISAGFSMQFIESHEDILDTVGDLSGFKKGCDNWSEFEKKAFPDGFTSGDSLLKRQEG